jgi:hypothetical protein
MKPFAFANKQSFLGHSGRLSGPYFEVMAPRVLVATWMELLKTMAKIALTDYLRIIPEQQEAVRG